MNVGPQKRLTKRRKDLYNAVAQGMTERKAIETIAKQYKTTEEAIYKDWQHRDKWGDTIPQIDTKSALQDALNKIDELRAKLWDKANNAESDGDRIRALSKLVDMEYKNIETYRSLGLMHTAPAQSPYEFFDEDIERLHEIVKRVAGPDIEAQENVIEILLEAQHLFKADKHDEEVRRTREGWT